MTRWIKMVTLTLVTGLVGACAAGPLGTPAPVPMAGTRAAMPPIDAATPARTETATFALG
jgi:hypothetical protein